VSKRAVNRYPSFYKGDEFLGLTFSCDYKLVSADAVLEDAFSRIRAPPCLS
jgi:hypothetical protein